MKWVALCAEVKLKTLLLGGDICLEPQDTVASHYQNRISEHKRSQPANKIVAVLT